MGVPYRCCPREAVGQRLPLRHGRVRPLHCGRKKKPRSKRGWCRQDGRL